MRTVSGSDERVSDLEHDSQCDDAENSHRHEHRRERQLSDQDGDHQPAAVHRNYVPPPETGPGLSRKGTVEEQLRIEQAPYRRVQEPQHMADGMRVELAAQAVQYGQQSQRKTAHEQLQGQRSKQTLTLVALRNVSLTATMGAAACRMRRCSAESQAR